MMLITMIRTLTSSQGQPAGALRGPKFAHTESKEAVSRQTHQALSPRGSTGGYMSKDEVRVVGGPLTLLSRTLSHCMSGPWDVDEGALWRFPDSVTEQ